MVLKGRFALDYELENFLNGLLLLDEIRDTSKLPSLSSLFRTILLISRFSDEPTVEVEYVLKNKVKRDKPLKTKYHIGGGRP